MSACCENLDRPHCEEIGRPWACTYEIDFAVAHYRLPTGWAQWYARITEKVEYNTPYNASHMPMLKETQLRGLTPSGDSRQCQASCTRSQGIKNPDVTGMTCSAIGIP